MTTVYHDLPISEAERRKGVSLRRLEVEIRDSPTPHGPIVHFRVSVNGAWTEEALAIPVDLVFALYPWALKKFREEGPLPTLGGLHTPEK